MSYAYLIYGFTLNIDIKEKEDYDWSDYIAERYRIFKPKNTDGVKNWDKYSRDKNLLLRDLNIRLEPYGNNKQYSYILGIHDSLIIINENSPEILKEKDLTINKEWTKLLNKITFDLQLEQMEHKWYLGLYNEI